MNEEQAVSDVKTNQFLPTRNRVALITLGLVVVASIWMITINNLPGPELCCLFDDYQPTFAEQNRILTALGSTELTGYEVTSGQIQVPKAQKGKFLAAISEKQAMPEALTKEPEFSPNPFLPRSQLRLQQMAQKKKQVCDMIKRLPFVDDARFEFDRQESRELFQPIQQTAVVMLTPMKDSMLNRQQLESVQRTVASAIAGISPHDVAVIDTNAGIAYDDIRDMKQANLIEMVSWKMQRREYYQRLLFSALSLEFPGIEVSVSIQASMREANAGQALPKKQSVFKLAVQPRETVVPAATRPSIGLNTTTTVRVDEPARESTHNPVRRATFEASLPHATREFKNSDAPSFAEKLSVKIVVPDSLLESNSMQTDADNNEKRFHEISRKITDRVKATLPDNVLSEMLPVDVVLKNPLSSHDQAKPRFSEFVAIQKFWPLWATLLTAIFSAIVLGSSKRSGKERVATQQKNSSQDLEAQLSELIDSDPATAARVLKNWIQQDS